MQMNRKNKNNKKAKARRIEPSAANKINAPCDLSPDASIPTDTLGSYTGAPEDGGKPVQDADDL